MQKTNFLVFNLCSFRDGIFFITHLISPILIKAPHLIKLMEPHAFRVDVINIIRACYGKFQGLNLEPAAEASGGII